MRVLLDCRELYASLISKGWRAKEQGDIVSKTNPEFRHWRHFEIPECPFMTKLTMASVILYSEKIHNR